MKNDEERKERMMMENSVFQKIRNTNDLALMLDQTLLKQYVAYEEIERFYKESTKYGFKMVAINSTMTNFGDWGAKVEDVRLMKSLVGDAIKVKASGGIRDLNAALAMIDAGAERIGTSAGVKIIEKYKKLIVKF